MKKQVIFTETGKRSSIAGTTIYHYLPNIYRYHVGHFIFLDYIPPFERKEKMLPDVGFAHPHRGIATLTYVLNGEAEHYDSRGHRATVRSGGIQWMKAGNGIIHDETLNADNKSNSLLNQGFQFWINLPARKKKEDPEYMAIQSEDLPLLNLNDNIGKIKVLVGEYDGKKSKIPTYSVLNLFHIQLNVGKTFTFSVDKNLEYAVFLPQLGATINDNLFEAPNLIGFDKEEGIIEVVNNSSNQIDFILFGGEMFTEPFVAYGPFVMTSEDEIREAYSDYRNGKYGSIAYK